MRIMWIFIAILFAIGMVNGLQSPDVKEEQRVIKGHKLDSLNLLIFVALLILVVVTIWLFKHKRLRFVHETGLAIIYGLIIGAIITYTSKEDEITIYGVYMAPGQNSTYGAYNPPDALHLVLPDSNYSINHTYQYTNPVELSQARLQEKGLEEKATFDPEVFFNVLLPPIIFNAGYSMKRKHFFKNFGAIIAYAFVGTTISTAAIGAITYGVMLLRPSVGIKLTDCLSFGALISATDPVTILAIFGEMNVDVDLYALVFGESVLNDAVAIVLSGAIDKYESNKEGFDGAEFGKVVGIFAKVFAFSFLMGSIMGWITALMTKFTHIRDFPLLETSLFFLMSYGTFLAAEAAELSGIVAVLFCGICQAHYTYNNLSRESQCRTKELFEVMNFMMESFVFIYIGVSTFTYRHHTNWDPVFISTGFLAIIVGRALNIYPLSFLLNLGRSNKIKYNFQHMMMFSGLRGAIAFALAIRNIETPQRKLIFSTTLLIVIITVIMCGGFTTQMLQWLKIRVGVEEETELQNFQAVRTRHSYQTLEEDSSRNSSLTHQAQHSPTDNVPKPVDPSPGRLAEKALLVRVWYNIDRHYVKPFLTHARPPLTETLPKCCQCLARILTTEQQLSQSSSGRHAGDDSDTDLIIDDQELTYGASSDVPSTPDGTPKVNGSNQQGMQSSDPQTTPPHRSQSRHHHDEGEDISLDLDLETSDTSPLLEFRGHSLGVATDRSTSTESELLSA